MRLCPKRMPTALCSQVHAVACAWSHDPGKIKRPACTTPSDPSRRSPWDRTSPAPSGVYVTTVRRNEKPIATEYRFIFQNIPVSTRRFQAPLSSLGQQPRLVQQGAEKPRPPPDHTPRLCPWLRDAGTYDPDRHCRPAKPPAATSDAHDLPHRLRAARKNHAIK